METVSITKTGLHITSCEHVFCGECISKYFQNGNVICPICRKTLLEKPDYMNELRNGELTVINEYSININEINDTSNLPDPSFIPRNRDHNDRLLDDLILELLSLMNGVPHANASIINVENTSSSTVAHQVRDQIAEDLHEEEDSNC
jgi:hypothetical protein